MTTRDTDHHPEADPLASATRFQRDLYLYWQVAQTAGGLPLTTRGYLTRPALRRVRARLFAPELASDAPLRQLDTAESEDPPLFFLRRLLERLGLLRAATDRSRLIAADRADMARYVAHPLAERLRICARLWVAGGWWPDRLDAHAEPSRLMVPAPPRVALARRRLLQDLATGESQTRLRIPAAATPQPGTANRRKASTSKHTSPARALATPPNESESQRAALLGPLAWLGIVTLETPPSTPAHPSNGRDPIACHTTPAAAFLRQPNDANDANDASDGESEAATLVERHGRVVIQPNFTIVAYPPLTAPQLLLLDSCAAEESFERTASYQLTRPSIVRARQYGYDAVDLRLRLEALTGSPLPANVSTTLADWARQAERVQLLHAVTLLEVANAALLDALLTDRVAARSIERRLTPTAALLTGEGAESARAWLLRRGELPASITVTQASALASEPLDQS